MSPKNKGKVTKIPTRRNQMILPHMVTQVAQHAQASRVQSPLDDDASTPPTRQDVEPSTQQAQVPLPEAPISMIPTPGFSAMGIVPPPSGQEEGLPSPTTPMASRPSTSISSRHTQDEAEHSQSAPSGSTAQGSRHCHHDPEMAPDGRPYIYPMGRGWLPSKVASTTLTCTIQSQFWDSYHTWGEIPEKVADFWFEKFGTKVAWRPDHEYQLRKFFDSKGLKRLSEMLMEVRKKRQCPGLDRQECMANPQTEMGFS